MEDGRSRGLRAAQLALDAAGVLVIGVIFATRHEAEDLFHLVWVILTIEAFMFGLRGTIGRIAAAAAAVVVYALIIESDNGGPLAAAADLLFSEWPLMLVIILLVAIMADRVISTSHRYAALYREASDRLLTAHEEERTRLARQLHDGVGQSLTAVSLTLDTATNVLSPSRTTRDVEATALVERARTLAVQALGDTRDLAGRLRPARLHERGLAAALEDLAANAGVSVDVRIGPGARRPALLDVDREVEAYRIAQEALANAARHAGASRLSLSMDVTERVLSIVVADDGRGFDPKVRRHGSLGIPGMYERAAMMGARLKIVSAPGAGTRVMAEIPLTSAVAAGVTSAPPVPAAPLASPGESGSVSCSSSTEKPAATSGDEVRDDVRVVIVDDHDVVREGLVLVLSREEGITVVAEAGDAQSCFEVVADD